MTFIEEELMKQEIKNADNLYSDTPLPRGITEFHVWADEIIALAGLPNNDSIKFALAVAITHLGPTEASKPKQYFIDTLSKGAATQVAFAVMDQLKSKQQALKDEAAKAALVEATTESVALDATK
jgi:hypothetical protein